MENNVLRTELKILEASNNVFLIYGYHGTTLQQIATRAGVNKSSIHYYFRSKEKLYGLVVELIIDLILNAEFDFATNREKVERPTWFLFTELYNNNKLFVSTLKSLHPNDWEVKLNGLKNWLESSNSTLFSHKYSNKTSY